ncbi:MAG: elongation factor Ts [Deltaproteobacteria bacterium]|nr:elongation factor Ts [Deltaproteobacteria bacterium]
MKIDTATIQQFREMTGAGIMDAKKALEESGGDVGKAIEYLKKQGQKVAAKKQERETKEGFIGSYVHTNGKVATLVALACESDFVANTDDFHQLAHDLAMQVAATDPQYVSPNEIPEDVIAKEREIFEEQLKKENRPEKIWEKIITGKLKKFYEESCLLKQPFIKEDKKTIEQLVNEKVLKLGENIQIKEIKRVVL